MHGFFPDFPGSRPRAAACPGVSEAGVSVGRSDHEPLSGAERHNRSQSGDSRRQTGATRQPRRGDGRRAGSNTEPLKHRTTETPNHRSWLITGCAGFIGSHLVESLLKSGHAVVGLDNFSTGHQQNLDEIRASSRGAVDDQDRWKNFTFIEGDIADPAICWRACQGVDYVLHQAALASVPASIADPVKAHGANVTGFLNILQAARQAGVKRLVYASSSAVYGDGPELPKSEDLAAAPLSPYAVNKHVNELYADQFARHYGFESVGLRYFNVFGPRQDPNGAYAAVISKWIDALINNKTAFINGDGESSRDFVYVGDVVHANLLAATYEALTNQHQVFNIVGGQLTTLNELHTLLAEALASTTAPGAPQPPPPPPPVHRAPIPGDIQHSQANIDKANRMLDYHPATPLAEGLMETMRWHAAGR